MAYRPAETSQFSLFVEIQELRGPINDPAAKDLFISLADVLVTRADARESGLSRKLTQVRRLTRIRLRLPGAQKSLIG